MIRELIKKWLFKPTLTGSVNSDSISDIVSPTITSPNRLDELCAKYNAYYTRTKDQGIIVLMLHLKDGSTLAVQSTNNQDAISQLTILAEKWHAIKS